MILKWRKVELSSSIAPRTIASFFVNRDFQSILKIPVDGIYFLTSIASEIELGFPVKKAAAIC